MTKAHTTRPHADWLHVHCTPLGKDDGWNIADIENQLIEFDGWSVEFDDRGQNACCLWKQFSFANFEGVKLALHEITHLADDEDHHPEVTFSFNRIKTSWATHSAGGITDNDWACAAKLDDALKHIG